jgi:hypothetical protein
MQGRLIVSYTNNNQDEKGLRPIEALSVDIDTTGVMINQCRSVVYKLVQTGELLSYREGRSRRIVVSSIKDYIARKVAAEPEFKRARYPNYRAGPNHPAEPS